jgi:enoyl-CoA hydratase
MEWHKNHENSPLAISKAIKSINANYKDGENGFETEIKSFGNVLEQSILKKELQPFREKKSSIYGRIIKSFRKINTNLKAG